MRHPAPLPEVVDVTLLRRERDHARERRAPARVVRVSTAPGKTAANIVAELLRDAEHSLA